MELNYDIMGLIGQQVEIRRKMDKVVDHLKEINKVEREFRGCLSIDRGSGLVGMWSWI